jgi:predicted PurR-regulated permease PerM
MSARSSGARVQPVAEAGPARDAKVTPGFTARVVVVALVVAAALALWRASDIVLVAFGGVLLAVALRALADLLDRYTPLPRALALPFVVVAILVAIGVLVWVIGDTLASQFTELTQQLPRALETLREWLSRTAPGRSLLGSIGQAGGIESVTKVLGVAIGTLGALANVLLLVVLGIYLAADPGAYRRGFLRLVPARMRGDVDAALGSSARALRNWLGGQLLAMAAVGVVTGIGLTLLGVPLALSLATIAALLEFVPFIGPIVAAIPAILIAFTVEPITALYVLLFYVGVQQLEGYVLSPLVQRWAVALPPALGVLSVVVLGVLFGVPGVLFAVPLTIVAIVLVRELYLD